SRQVKGELESFAEPEAACLAPPYLPAPAAVDPDSVPLQQGYPGIDRFPDTFSRVRERCGSRWRLRAPWIHPPLHPKANRVNSCAGPGILGLAVFREAAEFSVSKSTARGMGIVRRANATLLIGTPQPAPARYWLTNRLGSRSSVRKRRLTMSVARHL